MQLTQVGHATEQKLNHTQIQVTRVEYQYFQLSELILLQTPLRLEVAHDRCEIILLRLFVILVIIIIRIVIVMLRALAEVCRMHQGILAKIQ